MKLGVILKHILEKKLDIRIKVLEGGRLPEYQTAGAAGADCFAHINNKIVLRPGEIMMIPLGFKVEIPDGYELQIRARSGNARRHGIGEANGVGTIDSDYRGEVGVILINYSSDGFEINPGDRIAQAVIAPVIRAKWIESDVLSETVRGEGGFGSTGK